jgi:methyl-accepting chemotaxis protein
MKITTKLIASFTTVIALSGVMGFVGYRGITSVTADLAEVGEVREPSVEGLLMIQQGFNGVRAANSACMIDWLPVDKTAGQKTFRDDCLKDIKKGWALYEPLPQTEEEAKVWAGFVPKFNAWEEAATQTATAEEVWYKAKAEGKPAEAIAAAFADAKTKFAAVGTHFMGVKTDLDKLVEINTTIAKENSASGKNDAAKARTMMIGALVGMIAIAGVLAGLICLNISRSIRHLITGVVEIQESKNLTKRLNDSSKDEIGKLAGAFNSMIQTLHDIIAEVRSGSVQIEAGSSQIASASQSMAQGASEQASSLQQISASLEEISGQTQQSADNARQANTLSQESKTSADRGQKEMAEMNKAVNEIKASSGEISKIIKVIDEIAFQTNLLALNAAVEAARAGEAGKGFAVVAEEVRNLAQRSAEAAKNTSSMIEESVKRSENGVQIAGRVGQALEEITTSTNKVNTLLSEIASAASEQATGIGQVNQGVGQLDQVTQQNAGNSEELASSAEEMSSQVASLNELVAQFKVNNDGHAASRPSPSTPKAKPATPPPTAKTPAKNFKPVAPKAKPAGGKPAPNPEQAIPMENDEVLASF